MRTQGHQLGRWELSLFPDAGEAGGSWQPLEGGSGKRRPGRPEDLEVWLAREAERARDEAARRARSKVRRYCAANGLNRLGTLTYAGEGCHEPKQLRADLGRFFRRLRDGVGERFAYLWVPEWHASGHGLHAHFAVGRFIPRGLIENAWGHGFVHIKLIGNLPVGSGARAEARAAAGYLAKYISKDMERASGLNRYDVAQGFQPIRHRLHAPTDSEVIGLASQQMGGEAPGVVWRSVDHLETWSGPPALWLLWP